MKETKDKFIKMPEYPGGVKAIQSFIIANLKYPTEAFANKIEATVHIHYVLDAKGNVMEAKCIGNPGHGLDEEAIRVVKLLKYSPARNRKLRITFNKKIDIHFRLPATKIEDATDIPSIPESPNQFNYSVVASTQVLDKPKKQSFSYSINI